MLPKCANSASQLIIRNEAEHSRQRFITLTCCNLITCTTSGARQNTKAARTRRPASLETAETLIPRERREVQLGSLEARAMAEAIKLEREKN